MLTYAQKEAQTMILGNPRLILYSSAAANSALEFVLALQVAPLPFLLLAYIVVVKQEADRLLGKGTWHYVVNPGSIIEHDLTISAPGLDDD